MATQHHRKSAAARPEPVRRSGQSSRKDHLARAIAPLRIEALEQRVLLSAVALPFKGPFHVSTDTTDSQLSTSVAMDASGDFVVVWENHVRDGTTYGTYGVYGQRYNASGAPTGSQFQVSTFSLNGNAKPKVAMDGVGDFVITWETYTTGDYNVWARRYSAASAPLGAAFPVPTFTGHNQNASAVAMDSAGDFVVTWTSDGQHTYGSGKYIHLIPYVYCRKYNAAGVASGPEVQISQVSNDAQEISPSIAMDSAGDFAIAWLDTLATAPPAGFNLDVVRYPAAGGVQPFETLVNASAYNTVSSQSPPSISMDSAGDFVVAWESNGLYGSSYGIYARRYNAATVAQGAAFRPNSINGTGSPVSPSVAMESAGDFVIAWDSGNASYLRHFTLSGTPQGSEFVVGGATVAIDSTGDFVIAWKTYQASNDIFTISAQQYTLISNPASVSGRAWNDLNANGIQDPGEAGMDGVVVSLFNSGGVLADTTTTSGGGLYSFSDVRPGDAQYVVFTLPGAYIFSPKNAGGDPTVDSDADRLTGQSNPFTAAPSGSITSVDAGLVVPAQIVGSVFSDANGDGLRETGEATLPGWQVFLDLNNDGNLNAGEPFAFSDFNGAFTVGGLLPGNYLLRMVPEDQWSPPPSHSIVLSVGQHLAGADLPEKTTALDSAAVPMGGEFPIATFTSNLHSTPKVAADPGGDFVATWLGAGQSGFGVYAQRYNAAGVAQGSPIHVNTFPGGGAYGPCVAIDSAGDFTIAWRNGGEDGSGYGIYAQRYSSTGVPRGGEFRVNTYTTDNQSYPTIAMDAAGDFVVAWQSNNQDGSGYGIYAQRYSAAGVPQGGEFRCNTVTFSHQTHPSAAMDATGDFVISWQSYSQDGSQYGIYARRYNMAGVAQGNEFLVNTYTTGNQEGTSAAMDRAGDLVIAWESFGEDGSRFGIYAQRYNAAGVPQGGEFRANTYTLGDQGYPSVAMDGAGDPVIAWASYGQDGSRLGIYSQRYNAAGVREGSEFRVNTTTANDQTYPAAAMDGAGDLLYVWESIGQISTQTVYAQQFQTRLLVPPVVNPFTISSPREGTLFSTTGSFSATYPGDAFTATVNWGVGTAQALALNPDKTFTLSHAYDDNGAYDILVTITDTTLGVQGSIIEHVNVANVPPTASITAAPLSDVPEGALITLGSLVTDVSNADTVAGFIENWSVTRNGNPFSKGSGATFSFSPDDVGAYLVTLAATDKDGGVGMDSKSVTVTAVAPTLTLPPTATATAGVPFTAPGSFAAFGSDPVTATADYADGNGPQPLTLNGNNFSLDVVFASAGSYAVVVSITDTHNLAVSTASMAVTVLPPPQVSGIVVNGGGAQRSRVTYLQVTFDHAVTLSAGAVTLARLNTGGSGLNDGSAPTDVSTGLSFSTPDGGFTWVISFVGSAGADTFGSLTDGIYTLTIHSTLVADAVGDSLAGGDKAFTFHRLFGDVTGNGQVNALDAGYFRRAYGSHSGDANFQAAFDYNNDGRISALDWMQFCSRFGKAFIY